MDFSQLASDFLNFIETSGENYALIAIFLWILIEETGVPLAPTADMVLIFAGWQVALGRLNPVSIILLTVSATVIGASILYALSLRGGHPFVFKYGKYLRIDQSRLMRTERWVQDHRGPTLLLGRMVPGLKTVVSIVAGVFEVEYAAFVLYTALAATIWAVSSVTIGRLFGPRIVDVANVAGHNPAVAFALFGLLAAVVVAYFYRRFRSAT